MRFFLFLESNIDNNPLTFRDYHRIMFLIAPLIIENKTSLESYYDMHYLSRFLFPIMCNMKPSLCFFS